MKITTLVAVVIGIVAVGAIAYVCSPTAKYAMKGNIKKIENAVQLGNAIEILEGKNIEMQEKYLSLTVGMNATKKQMDKMRTSMEAIKAKPQNDLNTAKYLMYSNGVEQIGRAYGKLADVQNKMKSNILKHKGNIELLKAKLSYLESLKTVNSYIKDVDLGSEVGSGINSIIEEAIANEEAVSNALVDMSKLKSEMKDYE